MTTDHMQYADDGVEEAAFLRPLDRSVVARGKYEAKRGQRDG